MNEYLKRQLTSIDIFNNDRNMWTYIRAAVRSITVLWH